MTREEALDLVSMAEAQTNSGDYPTTVATIDIAYQLTRIADALEKAPEAHSEVLTKFFLDKLSARKAAAVQGIKNLPHDELDFDNPYDDRKGNAEDLRNYAGEHD